MTMNRFIQYIVCIAVASGLLLSTGAAFAIETTPAKKDLKGATGQGSFLQLLGTGAGFDTENTDSSTDLAQRVGAILKGFLSLLGVVFLILIIYGGILWMTAAGKEEQVTKARNVLQMATIGLVIVIVAFTLSAFIFNVLGNAVGGSGADGSGGAPPD